MSDQHEPCNDTACPQHGIAASNARQSEFYARNDRTVVAGPDEPEFRVPAYTGEDYSTKAIYNEICERWRDTGMSTGPLMGDDNVADNIRRAKRAAEGVRAYAKEDGIYAGESIFLAISDMMNDLRHLLDFVREADDDALDGYPNDLEALAGKDMHYQAEIRGEF